MTLPSGTRLGSYEIVAPLGAGGMGEVYRARDTRLSRDVAIKVLPAAVSRDADRLARFEKEARTASALNHPSIVTIYDIGKAGETSFIAMELVEGKTLREQLVGGPLPLRRMLSLSAQVADGLSRAHAAGIVHRDLKPENVMVTRDGFAKILDFGLAKLTSGPGDSSGTNLPTLAQATEPGMVVGTVGYMSPEQASAGPLDFRSDQFSLGTILYEMVTGKRAFMESTPVLTLAAIIREEPEAIAQVAPSTPANLVWIIQRCLEKDRAERYGSTLDLARDLAALRDHLSGVSIASGVPAAVPRRSRLGRYFLAGALAAAAVAAVAFLVGQGVQARRDREAPRPVPRTVTFRRGYLTGARFAPDGQTIVYSAAWDGKPSELFTTRAGSRESRPLGIFPAGILAISSEGEMAISLGCENRWVPCFGTLARVPLAGGAPREVLNNVASADWSPDGKSLAVVHVVEGRDRLEYPIGKVLFQTEGYLGPIRVSPDGDLVAFTEYSGRDGGIGEQSVVDRSGNRTKLADVGVWHSSPPLWSPTGKEIFYDPGREVGRDISRVSLSGKVRAAPRVPALDDVSREGLFLDMGLYDHIRDDIRALVPGASQERNLSWFSGSKAVDLSPDGRELLFHEFGAFYGHSGGSAQVYTTYLRNTDGSDPKMLGEGKALALSPDGKWALAARSSPEPHLVLLPTGVGQVRSLPGGGIVQYHWATFFPDGRRILIAAEEKGEVPRTYIQEISGGPPQPFAEDGMRATLVSPDGAEIAGTTLEGLHLIYRADGRGRARLIEGTEPGDFLVQWSGDGKSMFVRGAEEQPMTLYRVELATGRRERWRQLAPPDLAGFVEYHAGPRGARVTPDGRFYAYSFITDLERLTLIDAGKDWWK